MKIELNKREIFIIKNALYLELDSQKFMQGFGKDKKEEMQELNLLYDKFTKVLIQSVA
jgi:hypothetical protein